MQYVTFVGRALRGDFGQSLVTQRPAFYEVFAVFAPTMQLAVAGAVVSMLLGIPAGILAATRRNRPLDYVTMTLALGGMSMPVFWLGLLLLLLFSFTARLDADDRRGRGGRMAQHAAPPGPARARPGLVARRDGHAHDALGRCSR